jgi:endonuclease/exonuclease/phosphatase family metal-dependent hydrolase
MKLKLLPVFLLVLSCMQTIFVNAQQFTVATYNLRFDNPRDTGNLWVDRAPMVAALIQFHEFDIFGTQEALKNQLDDVSKSLPDFDRYGAGRDDGKEGGEHSAIFFRKTRFALLRKGDFWLSETPDKPTMGWDAVCCKRICSWVYLQDKQTKKKFYVFNAHFDHQGKVARVESGKLIVRKVKEIAGTEPVLVMGDLNGNQQSEWYLTLANSGVVKDAFQQVKNPYINQNPTFNSFGKAPLGTDIIDHIFTSRDFIVHKWGILTDTYQGKFPSDHFPVLVSLRFK